MTLQDLHLEYKRSTGERVPEDAPNRPKLKEYMNWLEENLIMMSSCVDDMTTALKKATVMINKQMNITN